MDTLKDRIAELKSENDALAEARQLVLEGKHILWISHRQHEARTHFDKMRALMDLDTGITFHSASGLESISCASGGSIRFASKGQMPNVARGRTLDYVYAEAYSLSEADRQDLSICGLTRQGVTFRAY